MGIRRGSLKGFRHSLALFLQVLRIQLFIRIVRGRKLRCYLKMEIEPDEVKNEEADVLDLSSFPIPVTSNLERFSKTESSAEVLILINNLEMHIKNWSPPSRERTKRTQKLPQEQAKPY